MGRALAAHGFSAVLLVMTDERTLAIRGGAAEAGMMDGFSEVSDRKELHRALALLAKLDTLIYSKGSQFRPNNVH